MTDAVFTARYVKATPRTDGDAYFTFSVPTEFHTGPLEMLGGMMPPGNAPVYVAIAILKEPPQSVVPAKPKSDRTVSQRAWALCQSPRFAEWLCGAPSASPEEVAERLRGNLRITSRGDLDRDPAARARFEQLEAEYKEASR